MKRNPFFFCIVKARDENAEKCIGSKNLKFKRIMNKNEIFFVAFVANFSFISFFLSLSEIRRKVSVKLTVCLGTRTTRDRLSINLAEKKGKRKKKKEVDSHE